MDKREQRVRKEAAMTDGQWKAYQESFKSSGRPLATWTPEQWADRRERVKAKVMFWDGDLNKMSKAELVRAAKALSIPKYTKLTKAKLLKELRSL